MVKPMLQIILGRSVAVSKQNSRVDFNFCPNKFICQYQSKLSDKFTLASCVGEEYGTDNKNGMCVTVQINKC